MTVPRSTEALLYRAAELLGDLRERFVFLGGAVRGLLITDPGVEGPRHTDDVDVIVGVTTSAEYLVEIREQLVRAGFKEDTRPDAPTCRWVHGDVTLDVMPTNESILGYSNRWYPHALETAVPFELEGAGPPISIRLISAPSFVATKLVAYAGRGGNAPEHADLEDIVVMADGRPTLLDEVEAETPELRQFIGDELSKLLATGLRDKMPLHLGFGDSGRLPYVTTTIERLARCPTLLNVGETLRSTGRGSPGATGGADKGSFSYAILGVEPHLEVRGLRPKGRFVCVAARLISHGLVAGVMGDGRAVRLEEARGWRHPPSIGATTRVCDDRKLSGIYGTIWPETPYETVWVYDVPEDAKGLRLCLPFDGVELRIDG